MCLVGVVIPNSPPGDKGAYYGPRNAAPEAGMVALVETTIQDWIGERLIAMTAGRSCRQTVEFVNQVSVMWTACQVTMDSKYGSSYTVTYLLIFTESLEGSSHLRFQQPSNDILLRSSPC